MYFSLSAKCVDGVCGNAKYLSRFKHFNVDFTQMAEAKEAFLKKYSQHNEYGYNDTIDDIVANEFQDRLNNRIFFDYTANGVYTKSQMDKTFNELNSKFYANSHSHNEFSSNTDNVIHQVRQKILKRFNVTSAEYTVVFTSGATGALKLIGESFPWTNNSKFMYLRQNHNSVLGIREYALEQGAEFKSVTEEELNLEGCDDLFSEKCEGIPTVLRKPTLTKYPTTVYSLFAYPALENFAGVKYPLEWISKFKAEKTGKNNKWLVLLDTAAFLSTSELDLRKYPADFLVMSFYKIVGYPTGLGALIVKNSVLDLMQKSFFGGGTVVMSDCDTHFCLLHESGCQRFEDGSLNFLSILALKYGLEEQDKFGVKHIKAHVMSIVDYVYDELSALKHSSGKQVVEIYGKHSSHDHSVQGPIINLSVKDKDGKYVGYNTVEDILTKAGFEVRTGSSCNPGACYGYLNVTSDEVKKFSLERSGCGDDHDIMDGKPLGGVRISFGFLSTFEEGYSLVQFFKKNFAH
ncbi:molybdenum cofactor sulfurase, putative [Entamoeba invadens IP1]|uniref:Molybdenum cofactor sulfurase, putative n=1 Tax=Entamoeba invadens IP1 TaxID=370355 RepID=A0A0A1UDC4_ENTIV|nr:molybdenum cofactor sulfurase, putative [Entamoeba invadens IP1]ELP94449.1 molybdenum cofactor sulfurase, putative [Entamoeba invadens IP1]|eukprot:XP_004261220.1 molybdenum cofactor sulfurase, putative [Entamoeba invadens IP1]